MTDLSDLTGKPLKHYARDLLTNQRYIIIALENETDPDTCSVIDYDRLDAETRSELINYVNSDTCQAVPEIWKLLDKKYFLNYSKATMLNVLKQMKQIKVVKSSQVAVQLPGDQTMTPKDVANAIREYEHKTSSATGRFNNAETTNVAEKVQPIENKNDEEIKALKEDVQSIKDNINSLTSSMADLISALKKSKK